MTKGGKRPGAGRKTKFNEPTIRLVRMVPVRLVADLDKWLLRNGKKPKRKKVKKVLD